MAVRTWISFYFSLLHPSSGCCCCSVFIFQWLGAICRCFCLFKTPEKETSFLYYLFFLEEEEERKKKEGEREGGIELTAGGKQQSRGDCLRSDD